MDSDLDSLAFGYRHQKTYEALEELVESDLSEDDLLARASDSENSEINSLARSWVIDDADDSMVGQSDQGPATYVL